MMTKGMMQDSAMTYEERLNYVQDQIADNFESYEFLSSMGDHHLARDHWEMVIHYQKLLAELTTVMSVPTTTKN